MLAVVCACVMVQAMCAGTGAIVLPHCLMQAGGTSACEVWAVLSWTLQHTASAKHVMVIQMHHDIGPGTASVLYVPFKAHV